MDEWLKLEWELPYNTYYYTLLHFGIETEFLLHESHGMRQRGVESTPPPPHYVGRAS